MLFLGFVITFFISSQVPDLTKEEVVLSNSGDFQKGTFKLDKLSFGGISIDLLYFSIYAVNYLQTEGKTAEGKPVTFTNLFLNIDQSGSYTDAIKYGYPTKIYPSIRGTDIINSPYTRSIFSKLINPKDPVEVSASTTLKSGSFYALFLKPTWWSFWFICFFVGIPLAYTFLKILNAYRRFILFGSPFTDNKKDQ